MKAVTYSRVSTDEQAKEGFSLEVQAEKTRQHIESEGWEFIKGYSDPGCSGKDLKRKEIQLVIKEIKEGRVQALVVHKLDRLTRNIGDLNDLVKMFQKYGVSFVSTTERIDTATAVGRMFIAMLGVFAQWYRENLSEEVRKGQSKRAEKGLLSVSVPMFGYALGEHTKLVVKEEESKWVQWIFEQYISGIGTTNIAKELNNLGIRRGQGALWDQAKVMSTIQNITYTGMTHWKAANEPESNRIIRQGTHEAIITQEVYNKAQRILQRRRDGLISLNSYEYVYGGILKCARCGGTLKGKYNKRPGDKLYRGYECSNKERYGNCDQQGISENYVTKLIFEFFKVDMAPDFFEVYKPDNDVTDEKKELLQYIAQSESRRTRWQLAYGDGHMPYDDFSKRMSEEMQKVEEWKRLLGGFTEKIVSEVSPQQAYDLVMSIKESWPMLKQGTRKQIIQSIFQKIVINKMNGKWKIEDIQLA